MKTNAKMVLCIPAALAATCLFGLAAAPAGAEVIPPGGGPGPIIQHVTGSPAGVTMSGKATWDAYYRNVSLEVYPFGPDDSSTTIVFQGWVSPPCDANTTPSVWVSETMQALPASSSTPTSIRVSAAPAVPYYCSNDGHGHSAWMAFPFHIVGDLEAPNLSSVNNTGAHFTGSRTSTVTVRWGDPYYGELGYYGWTIGKADDTPDLNLTTTTTTTTTTY